MSEIDDRYQVLGSMSGFLGLPTSDELPAPTPPGRFRHFANGSLYWSPTSGAHMVHGPIAARWGEFSWERGFLGYPVLCENSAEADP